MTKHVSCASSFVLLVAAVAFAQSPPAPTQNPPPAAGAQPPAQPALQPPATGTQPPAAQAPSAQPAAVKPEAQQWITKRVEFIRDLYGLDAGQAATLTQKAVTRAQAQDNYQRRMEPTLRSVTRALELAQNQPDQEKVIASLKSQLEGIHGRAPLSYSSLIMEVEGTLSQQQVSTGRAKIKERYAAKMAPGLNEALMVSKIDSAVGEPVLMPGVDMTAPIRPPNPTPTDTVNPARPAQPNQPPMVPPRPQPTPTPPPPPRVIQPAPPIAEWKPWVDAAVTKYQFTPVQSDRAKWLIEHYQKRAGEFNEKNKTAYEEANKLSDAAAKEKAVKELNKGLDKLYDELTQRIEFLATIEQRQKADKAAGKKPAAPATTPPVVTPADPHAGHNHP